MTTTIHALLKLSKHRVVALMLLCTWVGMYFAPKPAEQAEVMIIGGSIGIALLAAASASINHCLEQHIDGLMTRTQHRPLVQNHLSITTAIYYASSCLIIGSAILWLTTNQTTLLLTWLTTIGYGLIYTCWLKPATPQNIVIGGLAGATPPLLGWTCLTGHIHAEPLTLVLIIFTWTPPHFWALALWKKTEYLHNPMPILPITHSEAFTRQMIQLYVILTSLCAYLPYCIQLCGNSYLLISSLLNGANHYYSHQLFHQHDTGRNYFFFSITYLTALFVAMLIDGPLNQWLGL